MPKCCKCEANKPELPGAFKLVYSTDSDVDLGVQCKYFSPGGPNNLVGCYCEAHYQAAVLEENFVKNALAGTQKKLQDSLNTNQTLTKQNADLKTELDVIKTSCSDLEKLSAATTEELKRVRTTLEKTTAQNQSLKTELDMLKQKLNRVHTWYDRKDKEMSDLKAQDPEKAKLHASVKIGLDFSKYHQLPKLLLKWCTRLEKFDYEKILQEIHDRLNVTFQTKVSEEEQKLLDLLKNQRQLEQTKLEQLVAAHEKALKTLKATFDAPELECSEKEKAISKAPLESKLQHLQFRLEEIRGLEVDLNSSGEPNNPEG